MAFKVSSIPTASFFIGYIDYFQVKMFTRTSWFVKNMRSRLLGDAEPNQLLYLGWNSCIFIANLQYTPRWLSITCTTVQVPFCKWNVWFLEHIHLSTIQRHQQVCTKLLFLFCCNSLFRTPTNPFSETGFA